MSAAAAAASDQLARPRDFGAVYGRNIQRGLCLGGGGLFFVAWQVAYLQTLANHGVRVDHADRVVGTSAGSIVGSALVAGKLKRMHSEVSVLSKVPAVVAALAPASTLTPSQQRALDLFVKATDGDPPTVQAIGHAALAASTPKPEVMRRNISLVVGKGPWTSDALLITCVDAYTGERCVVTRSSLTSIPRAVAASSAVPGVFAPQPIGDRRCMDGGVSGTGTHLDLLAGAQRVLVLTLTDGTDVTEGMMTSHPGDGLQELEDLKSSGAEVLVRTPSEVDLLELMTPAAVPKALALGARQASADVGLLSTFWT
ncbi:MAG TPA: patatin-like phospholipase family protein [Acidimicrobiales bacterium]|nr:patatin-like phospholipase family protein [Acidimicrobiales bacterium]